MVKQTVHSPRFKGLGKGRRGRAGGGGSGFFLCHSRQHFRNGKFIIVQKLLSAHLDPQGNRLKTHGFAGKDAIRRSQLLSLTIFHII